MAINCQTVAQMNARSKLGYVFQMIKLYFVSFHTHMENVLKKCNFLGVCISSDKQKYANYAFLPLLPMTNVKTMVAAMKQRLLVVHSKF